MSGTLIRDLFLSDVTRDIPPVVYFHERSPHKLALEVSEYIITGGWPEEHPNHRRVPNGIHEQYVRLLNGIVAELDKPGGPELPTAWISGFYGSGKSSFAKLLGFALDGVAMPDGSSLAEAWLRRNNSPRASELRDAWKALRQRVEPIAVVFDIGSTARDNEHVHAATLRQVQIRLGYCSTEPLVADFELKLERDGEWSRFERTAQQTLGKPWASVKDMSLAEEDFSQVMYAMFPDKYTDPMSWFISRGGTHSRSESPEEAVTAIRDMLKFRKPKATLFLVVDEVSQFVLGNKDRTDRIRAFATALGSTLHGKAWLLALGQQKLDEDADESFLVWARDRFPQKLRVHLAATNIRDVVHKRLLQKRPEAEQQLREMFIHNRPAMSAHAYGCDDITPEEFVDVYPLLPSQIDLILRLTSELRARSNRAQGDDQAIRGLLQLLGELFRGQKLADKPVGTLVTLDQIYEVQHTALDSEVQASMARLLGRCTRDEDVLAVRAAKAVALLELIQETEKTDAALVAKCLYDRVDCGNREPAVKQALEWLRELNLVTYTEKTGYKIQSTAAEEWDRERRDFPVPRETIGDMVQSGLAYLLSEPERPRLQGRPFAWMGVLSDGRRLEDVRLLDARNDVTFCVDFRFLVLAERTESVWIKRSAETALLNRLAWVCGDTDAVETNARELCRSRQMLQKYQGRRESMPLARKLLLQQEENRRDDFEKALRTAIGQAFMGGRMYFRGRPISPVDHGTTFSVALSAAATRVLPDLFPHFLITQLQPGEVLQLVESELSGPSPRFMPDELGILESDSGRFVPACSGVVPGRIQEHITSAGSLSGSSLLAYFAGPPYGYTPNVVKACVAGLLRASRIRMEPEAGGEITAIRDAGVREIFEKDRAFLHVTIMPAGEDDIGFQARSRICRFFAEMLSCPLDREDHAIADEVARRFPGLAAELRKVHGYLNRLPGSPEGPPELRKLAHALEECVRSCRQTAQTVRHVKNHLDTLRDGVTTMRMYAAELNDQVVANVNAAHQTLEIQVAQLQELGVGVSNVEASAARVAEQLQSARPWVALDTIADDLQEIRRCYTHERHRLLLEQERLIEAARARVRSRDGFSTLTADQSHQVLRYFASAGSDTTVEAISPPLVWLRDDFALKLIRAEEDANNQLDKLLSEGSSPMISKVALGLQNREVASEADVEALVTEIRGRLLEPVRAGLRVRLV